MKQKMKMLLTAVLLLLLLTGCAAKTQPAEQGAGPLKITAAVFPAYDWVRNILGENPAGAELTLLTDSGVDLHSYQPSVDDILTISNSDLFIYVGGESDRWVSDALKQASNPDMHIISMLETLGDAARQEELAEGMQAETKEEETDDTAPEYDEHVWLSLRNAAILCDAVTAELSALDSANAKTYSENNAAYQQKLRKLDLAYQDAVSGSPIKTLLFGDRFPFRYLTEDYGLSYYAAFSGCSAETEAAFETITFLARKTDELDLPAVLTIDGSDQRIAQTIVQNTADKDRPILMLDSMQSVSAKDIQNGTTYLSVMEKNLEVLKQALFREEHK